MLASIIGRSGICGFMQISNSCEEAEAVKDAKLASELALFLGGEIRGNCPGLVGGAA